MAIIKAAAKLIARSHSTYHFCGSALTLGVPDIYASFDEIDAVLSSTGARSQLSRADAQQHQDEPGHSFHWLSAKSFFEMLGLSSVTSLDIPGCDHAPDLIHDLNTPLPPSHIDRFDLLVDPGTSEHVLDMKMCLTNITRALRVGGVLIQFTPIYSFNGGYFSINPNLLNDFYSQNGFAELTSYIIMWDRYWPYTGRSRCYPYSTSVLGGRHALADYDQCRFTPHLLLLARKMTQHPHIVVPIQDETIGRVRGSVGRVSNTFRAVARLLPIELRVSLDARLRRLGNLRRTRRDSFWI